MEIPFSHAMCKMNKKEVVTIIRSLLSSTNSSFGIYALNKEFKDETGIDIPLFNYGSLSEFLESIPDTVKLTGVYPVQKVSLVSNDASAHIVSLVKRQRRDKKSKKVVSGGYFRQNNRSKVYKNDKCKAVNNKIFDIQDSKQPKSSKVEVPSEKNKRGSHSKKPRPKLKKLNEVQSTSSDCTKIQTSNCFVSENQNSGSGIVYQSIRENSSSFSDAVEPPINIPCQLLSISDCFLQADEKIAANDLTVLARVGQYVEVYPCEITHPGFFYMHLRQFKKKLSRFMDKLQHFYDEEKEIPRLSEPLRAQQICAVRYSRNGDPPHWHRAQVEEILTDCLVVVRLVDFGTTAKILTKNIKPLYRSFSSFPRQAVSGSLANIKPWSGGEWSKTATKRFHELAFYRDLVGGVVSMDCDAYSLSVALSSTVGEEVHVNDTLVEEGLAEFDENVTNKTENSKTKKKESELGNADLEKESKLPFPIFYSKEIQYNTRLQKMFKV